MHKLRTNMMQLFLIALVALVVVFDLRQVDYLISTHSSTRMLADDEIIGRNSHIDPDVTARLGHELNRKRKSCQEAPMGFDCHHATRILRDVRVRAVNRRWAT